MGRRQAVHIFIASALVDNMSWSIITSVMFLRHWVDRVVHSTAQPRLQAYEKEDYFSFDEFS